MPRAGLGRVFWGVCAWSLTVDHASCGSRQGVLGCVWSLTVDHALCRSRQGDMGCMWSLTVDHASCGSRQGVIGCVWSLTVVHALCGSQQGDLECERFCLCTVWEYSYLGVRRSLICHMRYMCIHSVYHNIV